MSHAHTSLLYHVVFGPKSRVGQIKPVFRERLYEYLGGTSRRMGCKTVAIGGTNDHVHIVAYLTPSTTVEEFARVVKCNSSKWIHETFPTFGSFAWQSGYAAFTVSRSGLDALVAYVGRQEEHHRSMSFQDELRLICEKHGIAFRPSETVAPDETPCTAAPQRDTPSARRDADE